jgi:hypothetical protein
MSTIDQLARFPNVSEVGTLDKKAAYRGGALGAVEHFRIHSTNIKNIAAQWSQSGVELRSPFIYLAF